MLKKFFKALFANPLYKIMAALFAVVLWSYVLVIEDPDTPKLIEDVPVSFINESLLTQKNLVVRGDKDQILTSCDVSVTTPRSLYRSVTPSVLTATANLGAISTKGEFDIPILVPPPSAFNGVRIDARTPAAIHVEIDELVQKEAVPVRVEFEGTLPAGFYNTVPETVPSAVSLSGPKQDVDLVSHAVVKLDLSEARGYNDSIMVELRDAEGNVIPSTAFTSEPSVIVKMDVYPKKTVPINQDTLIVGFDKIAPGYQLNASGLTISPEEVEIAGPADILDTITSLDINAVDIQGWRESQQRSVQLRLPDGIIVTQPQPIELYVDITLITRTVRFDDLLVEVRGVQHNHNALIGPERISVSITASEATVDAISRGDIKPYVDVTDLARGTYDNVPVQTALTPEQKQNAVIEFSSAVTVVIEELE